MRTFLNLAGILAIATGLMVCVFRLTVDGWIFLACAGFALLAIDYLKYERTEER